MRKTGNILLVVMLSCSLAFPLEAFSSSKEAANDRGRELLSLFFLDALKDIAEVRSFNLSSNGAPAGLHRWRIELSYLDESADGDQKRICQVIAACYAVAEMGELQLIEVDAKPITRHSNVRATVVASSGDDSSGPQNWLKVFLKKAENLRPRERQSARSWMKSWHIRAIDPSWKLPLPQ